MLMLAWAVATSACAQRPDARVRLVVATVRQPATSLFFAAQATGCFADQGLKVEERTFELGRDALELLRDGLADAAISYETPLLRAAFTDHRLRALTTLHTSTRNTRLVARRGSGIRGFEDLAGKRIGAAAGTNADFFVDLALKLGGLPRGAASIVASAPESSVRALEAGALDAAVLSDPPAGEAERRLGDAAVVLRTDLYQETSLLVTRDDLLATRAPHLRALLRGLACAERRARTRPAETRALIAGRFPEQGEEELRAQLDRVSWGLGLDNVLLELMVRERDALGASGGVLGRPPALDRLLAPALLEEVYPESVMLLGVPGGGAP
jgi:NitT/TauT family transport system substrate-binding protein